MEKCAAWSQAARVGFLFFPNHGVRSRMTGGADWVDAADASGGAAVLVGAATAGRSRTARMMIMPTSASAPPRHAGITELISMLKEPPSPILPLSSVASFQD